MLRVCYICQPINQLILFKYYYDVEITRRVIGFKPHWARTVAMLSVDDSMLLYPTDLAEHLGVHLGV